MPFNTTFTNVSTLNVIMIKIKYSCDAGIIIIVANLSAFNILKTIYNGFEDT